MSVRAVLPICLALAAQSAATGADQFEFFETKIRPALVEHCYECHSAAAAELRGGLLLDSREGIRKGGESGPAVVPGKPKDSLLLEALRHESLEMPPDKRLAAAVVADFARWIADGAPDPRDQRPSAAEASRLAWQAQLARRGRWWSLQPLQPTAPPAIDDASWSREPVDRFVHAALRQRGLRPAPSADARTLLRRMSFVLTGLPPTPSQARRFPKAYAADPDAATAALADELLASPRFGERFARHWMDVVRYTDTYGYEWDNPAKGSWEYRDYLIRALNDDVGFDQLILEQLAGDLLPEPRISRHARMNESLIGPMFFHLGEHRHGNSLNFNGIHQDMVNNKIDAFSKAFLATTVACARCHDHKLDAVSQADYYALAGVFMSPRWTSRVIDAPGKHDRQISELKRLRDQIRERLVVRWRLRRGKLRDQLRQWAADNQPDKPATLDQLPWPLLELAKTSDDTIAADWRKLARQWQTTRQTRRAANQKNLKTVVDFDAPGFPAGWTSEGDGIAHGYVADGAPLIELSGDAAVKRLLERGYHTHALSSKLPGAIRLPSQQRTPGKFVSLRLQGGEWAAHLVVPQNAFNSEAVKFLDPKSGPSWSTLADNTLNNGVTRVFTEVMTSSLNPNFPPRTGLAKAGGVTLPHNDDGLRKRSWFSLTGIALHDGQGPQETLDVYAQLLEGAPPKSTDEAWRRIDEWFSAAVDRWSRRQPAPGDVALLNWLLQQGLLPNKLERPQADVDNGRSDSLTELIERYRQVESTIEFPRTANSMDERQVAPLDYRLNIRGDVDVEGAPVPRDFLTVFSEASGVSNSRGSGRLELARYLSRRDNPQTARVYVNRLWHWVFGTGIVDTPSDFGKLGGRPSHPELLDWLAAEFIDEGWSTKRLLRRLVLSRTFRQSSVVAAAAEQRDPDNRLLHHYPTRRLEAEAIRDSLLAVSGRLDPQLYGPPIDPPRAVEDGKKRLFSGPVDSRGRRSIYIKMSIMDPPKFLVSFNLPDLKLPTGRRDVTNVPAQALVLLNDPLVVQLADRWAESLVRDGRERPDQRVEAMFLAALGRAPTAEEQRRWTQAVREFATTESLMSDRQAWAELAHAMFNTKEFIYYR